MCLSLFFSFQRSCVGEEVTHVMLIWPGSDRQYFWRGCIHSYSSLSLCISTPLHSLHGAFSLILCMRISLRNLHQCAGVGRRRHTHTHTQSRSVNWWSFVMGSDSLSLSLSASLAHAGSVSCYATCLCNQSHSHRKVAWLDEQIPLRTADVTAVLDPPQH